MKNAIVLLTSFVFLSVESFGAEKQKSSEVDKVTVYRKGAVVERSGIISLPTGETEVIVKGLSPILDPATLQAKVQDSSVSIVSISKEFDFAEQILLMDSIQFLTKKSDKMKDSLDYLNAKLQTLKSERDLMMLNQEMKGSAGLTAEGLAKMVSYYHDHLSEIEKQRIETQKLSRELDKQYKELLQRQTAMMRKSGSRTSAVRVILSSKSPLSTKLNISYYVDEASWNPSYDVRVSDGKSKLSLDYKANVKQNTKEDWKNVKLVVSTLEPSFAIETPILMSYYLDYGQSPTKKRSQTSSVSYKTIKGLVSDGFKPLAYAVVAESGNNNFTYTDASGKYELTVPENSSVIVSCLGYESKTKYISSDSEDIFNVNMTEMSSTTISEWDNIAVEYDQAKSSVDQALQGRVSGVSVTNELGQPGAYKSVRVRGTSSLSGKSEPLYVVDGVPVGGDMKSKGSNPLASINPEDIVSMETLKDESATAIYGARAANGVIIVTTKNGNGGQKVQGLFVPSEYSVQEFAVNVDGKHTILSNNQSVDVNIMKYDIKADMEYIAIPKVEAKTFFVAKIPEWTKYNLLEGKANLYLNNEYKGSSKIETSSLQDTMMLSFGEDKDIVVKRENEKDYKSKNMLSTSKKKDIVWKLTLKNNKRIPVVVHLEDQYPISMKDDIKVELLETSGAKINELNGSLKWIVNLKPGEEKVLRVSYLVKSPSDTYLYVE
ncbi:MAG: mucoidy inhibitor MuiA family protein [Paludibacteraceae bacterium]|nr:mucoidy inhibitor MuiA family protein [Paludibacteraceae bacterium]